MALSSRDGFCIAPPFSRYSLAAQENTRSLASNQDEVCWPDDVVADPDTAGFFFGIGPQGQLGLHLGDGSWHVVQTHGAIALRRWSHVAAVFRDGEGVRLFIDGIPSAVDTTATGFVQAWNEGRGRVFVHGEIWNATSDDALERQAPIEVVAVDGMTLHVKSTRDEGRPAPSEPRTKDA